MHCANLPLIPSALSLCISMPMSHLSNALEKSKYMLSTFDPFSSISIISLWCSSSWESVDLPFLDLCWHLSILSVFSRWYTSFSLTILSLFLPNDWSERLDENLLGQKWIHSCELDILVLASVCQVFLQFQRNR